MAETEVLEPCSEARALRACRAAYENETSVANGDRRQEDQECCSVRATPAKARKRLQASVVYEEAVIFETLGP